MLTLSEIVSLVSRRSERLCTADALVIPLPLTPPAACFMFALNPFTVDPKGNSHAPDKSDAANADLCTGCRDGFERSFLGALPSGKSGTQAASQNRLPFTWFGPLPIR